MGNERTKHRTPAWLVLIAVVFAAMLLVCGYIVVRKLGQDMTWRLRVHRAEENAVAWVREKYGIEAEPVETEIAEKGALFDRWQIDWAFVTMEAEGRTFKGIIFFGLMLTPNGPKVLEYNARFGDPETQVVLPRLKGDRVDIFEACIEGTLDQVPIAWEDNAAVCIVLASGGYPVKYAKGYPIEGLHAFDDRDDMMIFHAGTALNEEGQIVTSGGRVLGVVALDQTLDAAIAKGYENLPQVHFKDEHFRTDIGRK